MTAPEPPFEPLLSPEEVEGLVTSVDVETLLPALHLSLRDVDDQLLEQLVVEYGGLTDPIGQLQAWLAQQLGSFASWIVAQLSPLIAGVTDWIAKNVKPVLDAIRDAVGKVVIPAVEQFVKSVQDFFTKTLPSWFDAARKTVEGWLGDLGKLLEGARRSVADIVDAALRGVGSLLEGARKVVEGWIADLGRRWEGFMRAVGEWLEGARKTIASWLDATMKSVEAMIAEAGKRWSSFWEGAAKAVGGWIEATKKTIGDWLESARKGVEALVEALRNAPAVIEKAVRDVSAWVWERLPDWAKSFLTEAPKALTQLGAVIQGFVNSILRFPEWFPRWFEEHIAAPIASALQALSGWIWERLPDWLRVAVASAQVFFEKVKEFLEKVPSAAWDFLTKTLPSWLERVGKALEGFVKDPVKWLEQNVATPLWNLGKTLWSKIAETAQWLQGEVSKLLGWVVGGLEKLAGDAWGVLAGMAEKLWSLAKGAASVAAKIAEEVLKEMSKKVGEALSSALKDMVARFKQLAEKGPSPSAPGEIEIVMSGVAALAPAIAVSYSAPAVISSISHTVENVEIQGELKGEPLGLGLGAALKMVSGALKFLMPLGESFKDAVSDFWVGVWIGLFASVFDTLRFMARAGWKSFFRTVGWGDLPIEMPSLDELIEFTRRVGIEKHVKSLRKLLDYYGLPDWYVEHLVMLEDELYIEVTDRFGSKRKVPLSSLYEWPSISEIASWAIHDVFGAGRAGFEEYFKWADRMGVPRDIAILQYISRFKYPPPSTLWTFATRALAGLAWYTPSADDMATAKAEAEFIGARAPLPPSALNFQAKKLFDALSVYMTWHDLANYAWLPDWTSDNWLIIDTLADIPGKIDVRWMTRHGLMDFMAAKGIGLKTPASQFTAVVEGAAKNPQLLMDLTLMSRLIQATGLHPYYVPIVVVAESMQAFTDERTLLRTGVVNMLERGYASVEEVERLLANLADLSFKVAYFDMSAMDWREGYVNVPLAYLPAERRLIELRAILDWGHRNLETLKRQLMRMAEMNYASVEEYEKAVKEVVGVVGKSVAAMLQALGARPVKLEYSQQQLELDKRLIELRRYGELLRRLRGIVRHSLYPMLSRFAQGYVSESELDKYINDMAESLKMMDEEKKFLKETALLMRDLAKRQQLEKLIITKLKRGEIKPETAVEQLVKIGWDKETAEAIVYINTKTYVPTISTLATLVELVPEAISMFNKVCDAQGVPEEERKYWLLYIQRKTVKDEVSRLVSELITDYAQGKITDADWNAFMTELKKFGYTDEEVQILTTIAKLRRQRLAKEKKS